MSSKGDNDLPISNSNNKGFAYDQKSPSKKGNATSNISGYTESSFTVVDPEPTFNSDKIQWESYNRGMPEWVTIRDNNNQLPSKDQLVQSTEIRRTSVDPSASRITTNNSSQPVVKWTRIKAPGVIKNETISSTFEQATHDNVRSMNSARTVSLAEPQLAKNPDINVERKSLIPSGPFSSTTTPRIYKPLPVKWTRIKASGNAPNEKQESKEISKEKDKASKRSTTTSRSRDNLKQQTSTKIKENISRKSSLIKSKSFIESPRQQHVQSVQKSHNLCQTKLFSIPVESDIQNLVAEVHPITSDVQIVKKSKDSSQTKRVSIPVESNNRNLVVNKQEDIQNSLNLFQTKSFFNSVEPDIQNVIVSKQHDGQSVQKSKDLQIKSFSIPVESNIRNEVVNKQQDVQESHNLFQTKLLSTPVESEIHNAVMNKEHDGQSVQDFSQIRPLSVSVESDIQSVIVKKKLDVQSNQKYGDLCQTKPFSATVVSDIQNVVVNKQHDIQSVQKSNDLNQTVPVSISVEPDIQKAAVNKHPYVQGVKKSLELSQTKPFSISVEPDIQKAVILNKPALKRRDSIERLKTELKDLLDSNLKEVVDVATNEELILEKPIAKHVEPISEEQVQVDVSIVTELKSVEATIAKIIVHESKTERNESKKIEIAGTPLVSRKTSSAENLRNCRDKNVEHTNLLIVKSVKSNENMAKTDEEKINVIKYMEQQKQRRLDKLKEDKIKKQMEAKVRKERLKKLQSTTLAIVTKNVQNKKAKSATKTVEAPPKPPEVNERHIISVPLTKPKSGTNKHAVKSRKIPMRSSIESLKRLDIKPSSKASRVSLAVTSKSSMIEIHKIETNKSPTCEKFETPDLEKVEKPVSPSKGLTVKIRKHRPRKSVDLKIIEELKNTMQERIDKLSSVIENFSQNAVEVIRQTSSAGLNKTSQEIKYIVEEPKPEQTHSPREKYIAACIIQSAIRGFIQRKKYQKLKQKYIQTCDQLQLKCESDDMRETAKESSAAPSTPIWLKRGIVKPCPYNFIYAVKKKLNLAITGHVSYVDSNVNTINTMKVGSSSPELFKGDDQSKNSWRIHSKSEPKLKSPPMPFLTPLICQDYHTLKSPVESVNENSGKASPYANDTFVKSTSSEDILNKAFIISEPKSSAKSKTSLHTEQQSVPANNLSFKEQIISDLKALEEVNKKLSTISNAGNTSLEFSSISSDIVKENNLDLTNNNNENKCKEISEKNISMTYSNTSIVEDINHKITQTKSLSDKNKKSESSHISEESVKKCDKSLRKIRDDISDVEQLTKPTDMLRTSTITSIEAPTKTYVKCDNLSKVDSKSNDLKEVLRYINDLKSSKTFIANKITQTSSKSDEKGDTVSRNNIEEEALFRKSIKASKSEPEQNNLKQESAKSINLISNISNDFNTGPTITTIKTDENITNIANNNQPTRKYNNNDMCYIPPLDLSKIRSLKTHRKSDGSTSMSSSGSDTEVQIKTNNINYERGDNIGRDVNILSFEQQVDRYSTEFEHSLTKSSSSTVSSVGYTKQTTYSEKYSTKSNTSSDDSRYSSLGKLDQLIREEHMRGMHLKTLLKNKEQALIDRTKGEIAMLEQKKRHLKEAGQMNEVSSIKKKQRGLLLNLQQERHEMDRLKKRQKKTYQERKNVLKEKHHNMKLHLANQNIIKTGRQDTSSRPKNVPFKGIDLGVVTKSRTENDALSLILSHREEELQKRRTHVETLIKWSQRLDEKEREVVEMENMLGIRNESISLAQLMEAPADLHTPATDEQRFHRTTQINPMNNSTNLLDNKIEQKKEIETQTTEIAIHPREKRENDRKARKEYKKVKGFDLNRLWKNMTGQKIKHFNDDDIILMTKDNLNKFYEDAKTEALKMFSTADDSVANMFNQSFSDNGEPIPVGKSELESFCSHYKNKEDNKIIEIVDDAKKDTQVLSKLTITKAAIVNIFHSKSSSGSNTSLGIENVPLDNKADSYNSYISSRDSQECKADTIERSKQQPSELHTNNNMLSSDSKVSTERSEDLNITASDIISTIDELTNVLKKNNASLIDTSRIDETEIKETIYRTNDVADVPETITLYKTMSSMKSSNSNSDGKLSFVNDTSSVSLDKDNYIEESFEENSGSVQTMNQSPVQSINESDMLETAKSLLSDIQSVISEYRSGHRHSSMSSYNTNSEQSEDKSVIMNSENQDDDVEEVVISVTARYPGNATRDPLLQSTTTDNDSNISVEDNVMSQDNIIIEELDQESISDIKADDNIKEYSIPPIDIDNYSAREESPKEVKDLEIYSEIASSKESEEAIIQSSIEEEEESRGSSYESDLEKRLVSIDEGLKGISHKFEKIPMLESKTISKLSLGTQDYLSDFESDFTTKESIKILEHDESKIDDDYSVKDISEGLEQISEEVDDLNRTKDVGNKEPPSTSVAEENFSEIESEISSKDKDDSDNQISEIVKDLINENIDVQNEHFWCEDPPTKLSENLDINVQKLSEIIVPNSNLTEQQDVRQRVHQILSSSANANRSPRVQDLWVTTNEALTPSPGNSPPESPAESLQHFGSEAEELRRKQYEIEEEIKQIQQQSEHLEYCYVREIPNKPPPPYTPPGDSPPSQESSSTRTSLRNSITNLITKENVTRMVTENVEFMYDAYVDGKLENMEFKSVNEEDILNTAHEKFIFDLCKEIMLQHYTLVTARSNLPVWLKPKQIQQKLSLKTLGELTVFITEIMKLFNFENVKDVGRKRELSSKIHTREVKEEISDWKSLDQDYELLAKNKATNDVMDMLLNETAKAVKAVLKKKYKK